MLVFASALAVSPGSAARFALAGGRVRSLPTDEARIVGRFRAGRAFTVGVSRGEWVNVGEGWVHESLLGDSFVPAPKREPGRVGLFGWVVSVDDDGVFELVDTPSGLELCERRWGGHAPPCLRATPGEGSLDVRVDAFWNDRGTDVQRMLAGSQSGPTVRPAEPTGLTIEMRQKRGLRGESRPTVVQIKQGPRLLWREDDVPGEWASIERAVNIGGRFLLVTMQEGRSTSGFVARLE